MFANLLANQLFQDICRSVMILIIGIFAMRIIRRLLKNTLEKSKLEKAAHSLITSLASAAMYVLLGLMVASSLGIDVTSIVALASVLTLALSLAEYGVQYSGRFHHSVYPSLPFR